MHVPKLRSLVLVILLANAIAPVARSAPFASLVLRGGTVYTLTPEQPTAEAIAVRDGRIVFVGADQDADRWIGPQTNVIHLRGRFVLPGLIESHGHFVSLGESLMSVDLNGARNFDEVVQRVATAVAQAKPGEWITGRGWHQEKWDRRPQPNVEGTPLHDKLSQVSPRNPVLLMHASGHMCLANALAMKLAGITRNTRAPKGGDILRDADGAPTGVFRENAMAAVQRAYDAWRSTQSPQQRESRFLRAVELAGQECLQYGVTSFHDAGVSFATVDRYKQLAERGDLPVRLYVMLSASNDELAAKMARYRMQEAYDNFLSVRAVKRWIDGALGSHGAWLLEPYDDLPTSSGHQTLSSESLRKTAQLCLQYNYQLCVHAIGDRANREVLDIFQEALASDRSAKESPSAAGLTGGRRWRIEHAQHLSPVDIPRFHQLGVIASMQAIHATSDAPYVIARLGARRARTGAYAWRSLIDAGARVANGTDVPVESVNPFACLYASVTREVTPGVAFFPEQCMTRREAIESYTVNGAYASFSEAFKGRLTVDRLADLIVIPVDPFRCPPAQLRDCRPDLTILGGRIVYQRRNEPREQRRPTP